MQIYSVQPSLPLHSYVTSSWPLIPLRLLIEVYIVVEPCVVNGELSHYSIAVANKQGSHSNIFSSVLFSILGVDPYGPYIDEGRRFLHNDETREFLLTKSTILIYFISLVLDTSN